MMQNRRIYWIRESTGDERPSCVTYYDPSGQFKTADGYKKYQGNVFVSMGKPGYPSELWFAPDLFASTKGRTPIDSWDFYECSGTFGAFSQPAIDTLSPFFDDRFETLPATLEGLKYFCLRCKSRVDCLDKSASDIVYFDEDEEDVQEVRSYAFRNELLADSMIFAIPELSLELFCTDPVPHKVVDAGLQGFDFELVAER